MVDDPASEEARAAVNLVRRLTGRRIESISALDGGEINAVYRVRTADDDLVVRWVRGARATWHPDLAGEVAAMRLASAASVPCPRVVFHDDTILVTAYVEGTPLSEADATDGLAYVAGRLYGQLHARRGTGCGPIQADGSDPGWPADVFTRDVANEAEEVLARPSRIPQGLALNDVATAAEIVEELAVPLRSRLVHGDASLTNTLVCEGRIVAVIDFEVSWYADPAIDLAWWWWNSPATALDFQRGCEDTSEATDDRRLWVHRLRLLVGLANAFAHVNQQRAKRIGRFLPIAIAAAQSLR